MIVDDLSIREAHGMARADGGWSVLVTESENHIVIATNSVGGVSIGPVSARYLGLKLLRLSRRLAARRVAAKEEGKK